MGKMLTDGTDVFTEQLGSLVNLSREGQLAMRETLDAHLKRIERDAKGLAIKLYPFTRAASLAAPRFGVTDPRMAFGRPVIAGSRVWLKCRRRPASDRCDATV